MRQAIVRHIPAVAGGLAMILIAASLSLAIPLEEPPGAFFALPVDSIPLPSPENDVDGDSYGNDVDLFAGDLHARIVVDRVSLNDERGAPYLIVGTQDDHFRLGAGRDLEWYHIVDPDALGHKVGGRAWEDEVLRAGVWHYSEPLEGNAKAFANSGRLTGASGSANFPQTFWLNMRDDASQLDIQVELRDAKPDPDGHDGTWMVHLDLLNGTFGANGLSSPLGHPLELGDVPGIRITVEALPGLDMGLRDELANKWSPRLHFSEGERFYPTNGNAMAQFHGFAPIDPKYRTWNREFSNGADAYVLLLADFTGDRKVDHHDAAVMTDILRSGGAAPPTVYTDVRLTTGDQLVIQYWFLYMYNFVSDENGDDIPMLAHNGDREFMQLHFDSLDDALNGNPSRVAYSQHYHGVQVPNAGINDPPFSGDTHPNVYVARGSHASYPAAGDDSRFRNAFAGYGDVFDGNGDVWEPGNYTLEHLGGQEWFQGHKWGPLTRFARELGTSTKPLLQYNFAYPFTDPIPWTDHLKVLESDELAASYGSS